MSPTPLDLAHIRTAPKALLHDHLDGGLRPATVLELARQVGYDALPADDADSLAEWFAEAAGSGSLATLASPSCVCITATVCSKVSR